MLFNAFNCKNQQDNTLKSIANCGVPCGIHQALAWYQEMISLNTYSTIKDHENDKGIPVGEHGRNVYT